MPIDPELEAQLNQEFGSEVRTEEETPRMAWEEFQALKAAQFNDRVREAGRRKLALDRINVSDRESSVNFPQQEWDEEERVYNSYLLGPAADGVNIGGAETTLMKAVGGPYDGMPINVPPGGTAVAMPSAFGQGDLKGSSLYERYITDEGVTVMRYVGQGNQTDEEDEPDGRPKLILP